VWVLAQEDTVTADQLAVAFRALSNPNRLRIYQVIVDHCREHGQADLANVPAGCAFGDFMQRLNIGASTVSHHVRALSDAGLIRVEREGRRRFCHAESMMQSRLAHFFEI
jgi:DNA-binding transcriptional ArsR family regulator